MAQAPKKPRSGKRDIQDHDSEDDGPSIQFFIPGEDIDTEVLVTYIVRFVDDGAKIKSGPNPSDPTRVGFNIIAKRLLNPIAIRDIINDSKDWDLEQKGRKWRDERYRYAHSETAKRRARKGASKGNTNKPTRGASIEPGDPSRRPSIPVTSSGGYYQQEYATTMSRDPGQTYQQYEQVSGYPQSGARDPASTYQQQGSRDQGYGYQQSAPRDQVSYRPNVMQDPGSGQYRVGGMSNYTGPQGGTQSYSQPQYQQQGSEGFAPMSPPPAYSQKNPGYLDQDPDQPDPDFPDPDHPHPDSYRTGVSKSSQSRSGQQDPRSYNYRS